MMKISACMLTLNECDHVALSIASLVDIVDELVVLDGGSTDGTADLATQFGSKVKVHIQPQTGNPYSPDWDQEARRQRLEELCRGDWVMQIDADEIVSDTFSGLRALLTGASEATLCYGVNRLDYCADLYHGYLPYTAHPPIPRIWRNGAVNWLTGKALHMTPYRYGTTQVISSFPPPVFIPSPLLLHHLHRASWIGKSKEKRRFDEMTRKPTSRAAKLGAYNFESDVLPRELVPASIERLRHRQKLVLMEQLGVCDDFSLLEHDRLPAEPQGFFLPENMRRLSSIIYHLPNPLLFVEIGSWLGSSTRFLAQQAGGCVIAIDSWTGSAEHQSGEHSNRLPLLHQQFLRNCRAYRDQILPIRLTSHEALSLPIKDANLIYIDGAHDYDSVLADLRGWRPRLAPCGVLCGDDWNWGTDTPVRHAVMDFAKDTKREVHSDGNFWWLV